MRRRIRNTQTIMLDAPRTAPPPHSPSVDPALCRYVQGLEALFIDVRGRGVQWSPSDGDLAMRWYRAGVELPTVARLLAEASETWRYHNGESALPQSLSWIQKAVERASSGVPTRHAESATADLLPDDDAVLAGLISQGRQIAEAHPDPAVQRATLKATEALARLRAQASTDDLLDKLAAMRPRIIKAILIGVGPAAAARVRTDAESRLAEGLGGRVRVAALQHELACATDRAHHVALPYWEGWRRPSAGRSDTALIASPAHLAESAPRAEHLA